ncbi:hypothetical protein, partial [Curtobacterium sp. B8]|uniref:hypothetical protein n=1 Tax=Curtobacterium sp. B8 TaxID=95611 RepID=UPI0004CE8F02
MHQNQKLVEARIERVLSERITPAVHQARTPVDLAAWQVPDEPVPAAEALAAEYRPFAVGEQWARAWSRGGSRSAGPSPSKGAGRPSSCSSTR